MLSSQEVEFEKSIQEFSSDMIIRFLLRFRREYQRDPRKSRILILIPSEGVSPFPWFEKLIFLVIAKVFSMLASIKKFSTTSTLCKVFASHFSTLNPILQAERVSEVRNVLNSVF